MTKTAAPIPAATATAYPAALVARPLLLPASGIEGGVRFVTSRFHFDRDAVSFVDAELRGRLAFGTNEVEAAVELFLLQDYPDSFGAVPEPDRLQALFLAARHGLDRDQSVGVQLTAAGLTGDFRTIRPGLAYQRKAHLAPHAAVDSAIGLGFQRTSYTFNGATESQSYVVVEGQGRIQAQIAPTIAAEGRATLRLQRATGTPPENGVLSNSSLGFEIGVGVVATAAPGIDVVAAVDVLRGGGDDGDVKRFTLGVVARRVP